MSALAVTGIVILCFISYVAIGIVLNWVAACLNTYWYGDRDLDDSGWYAFSAFLWPAMWPCIIMAILWEWGQECLKGIIPRVYIFQVRGRVGDYNGSLVPTSIGNYFKATYKHQSWPPQQTDLESLSNFLSIDGWRKVNDTTWTKFISKKSVRKFYLEDN